jgi:hypothetical protein
MHRLIRAYCHDYSDTVTWNESAISLDALMLLHDAGKAAMGTSVSGPVLTPGKERAIKKRS